MTCIWLIGASEGIGRALAVELGKDQRNFLILSARQHERLVSVSNFLTNKPLLIEMDVENKDSIKKAFDEIKNSAMSIDKIIYCAGYYKPMSAQDIQIDEVEKMIQVNLLGALRVLGLVIPQFINQKMGHIVLIGSIAGYIGLPKSVGYGASKAALINLAENLKCDLTKYDVKVQVINPGFVKTRLTDQNSFAMPGMITPEQAAVYIVKAMNTNSFESRFPFMFANFVKLISKLPYWLYFKVARVIK